MAFRLLGLLLLACTAHGVCVGRQGEKHKSGVAAVLAPEVEVVAPLRVSPSGRRLLQAGTETGSNPAPVFEQPAQE